MRTSCQNSPQGPCPWPNLRPNLHPKQWLSLACLLLLLAGVPVWAREARPPDIEAAWVEGLKKTWPQKSGEQWWVITWQNGKVERAQSPPRSQQGISSVRWHINDKERATTGLPDGSTLIQTSGLETVTYVYPAFWSGTAWLREGELKQQAPAAYRQVLARATHQHRTIILMQRELQYQRALVQAQTDLDLLMLDYKQPGLSKAQKSALAPRIIQARKHVAATQRALAYKLQLEKVFPTTLVRTHSFLIEAHRLRNEIKGQPEAIQALQEQAAGLSGSEAERKRLRIRQLQQDLKLVQAMIAKYESTEIQFRAQGRLHLY